MGIIPFFFKWGIESAVKAHPIDYIKESYLKDRWVFILLGFIAIFCVGGILIG